MSVDLPEQALIQGYQAVTLDRFENGVLKTEQDCVAQEVPIAMSFNGISHAVMLATPLDLEDFARGFSLTEGIVEDANQIYGIDVIPTELGIRVEIEIASACFMSLKDKRRNLTGRTGCGLCGTERLSDVLRPLKPVRARQAISHHAINHALQVLPNAQPIQSVTGATHAAAWFNVSGERECVREDVGRHNALDKLIGAGVALERALNARSLLASQAGARWRAKEGFLVVTSRASMEMVQKTISAGFSVLVAVSAPTQLAIDLAQRHGVSLVGFARQGKWSIYSGSEQIVSNSL